MLLLSVSLTGCSAAPGKGAVSALAVQSSASSDADRVDGIPMDGRAAVVADTIVDVFSDSDIQSDRVTQALYNQPVSILEEKNGWSRVAVVDGSRGWVRSKFLDKNTGSVYGHLTDHKIVVTSKEKSIYSSPSSGYTIKEALMGSEFLTFNNQGDAYEVYLPGNKTGWIEGSGIIHVKLDTDVPVTRKEDFVATALKFKGASFLLNGVSSMGIDASGLVYISARINGVDLPRNIEGQYLAGDSIDPSDAGVGDLVFLCPPDAEKQVPASVGICIGNGSYIYADRTKGYVDLCGLDEENPEGQIIAVRRIFIQ